MENSDPFRTDKADAAEVTERHPIKPDPTPDKKTETLAEPGKAPSLPLPDS